MNKISQLSYKYPIPDQNILFENIIDKKKYLKSTWISVPEKLLKLINGFLKHKCEYGSLVEKKFYRLMTEKELILRLFEKRPLTFTGFADCYSLKSGTNGIGNWDTIGTDSECEPLVLANYMSYDEIEISAFLSFSCYTPFINNGSRYNAGKQDTEFHPEGIYMGQIGARFQVHSHMEWKYMIVDSSQNTEKNGYGKNNNSVAEKYLKLWADFYNVEYFPTYTEAMENTQKYFGGNPDTYLNIDVYKQRIKYNAAVFLEDANYRAKMFGKKAFCHAVGLGLGVWAINKKLQQDITVKVYMDLLTERELTNISDLYLAWFFEIDNENSSKSINGINIHFGKREPHEPLQDPSKLLVCNWAWDANSYVGNEYWDGYLGSSGDPAAACSSFVAYFGNPDLYHIRSVRAWE
jgi:hypothetical protein